MVPFCRRLDDPQHRALTHAPAHVYAAVPAGEDRRIRWRICSILAEATCNGLPGHMPTVRLSPQAITDIEDVFEYGPNQFGLDQARLYHDEMFKQFDLLAEYPRLGLPIASTRHMSCITTEWNCQTQGADCWTNF